MRIVFDLDETLCEKRQKGQEYSELKPIEEMVDYLRKMKLEGHYIIINTARNMVTQDSNLGKINKNIGKVTLDWLDNWDIPYDEIYFAKPYGDIYIDDKSIRPQEILAFEELGIGTEDRIHAYLKSGFKIKKFIKKLFLN